MSTIDTNDWEIFHFPLDISIFQRVFHLQNDVKKYLHFIWKILRFSSRNSKTQGRRGEIMRFTLKIPNNWFISCRIIFRFTLWRRRKTVFPVIFIHRFLENIIHIKNQFSAHVFLRHKEFFISPSRRYRHIFTKDSGRKKRTFSSFNTKTYRADTLNCLDTHSYISRVWGTWV